jgi:hypothetical protein
LEHDPDSERPAFAQRVKPLSENIMLNQKAKVPEVQMTVQPAFSAL